MANRIFSFGIAAVITFALFMSTLIHASSKQQKISTNSATAGIHKLPIRKIANSNKSVLYNEESLKYLEHTNVRLGRQIEKLIGKQSAIGMNKKGHTQYIEYYGDYSAQFTIGNPPQQFTLLLDMLSANLWVPDKSCDNTQKCDRICDESPRICFSICDFYCCDKDTKYNSSTCDIKRKFDSDKSKTYRSDGRDFRFLYFDNFADGFLGNDILRFGEIEDTDVLTVDGVVFGQATTIARFMQIFVADGILGLAFRSSAVADAESPIHAAIRQGLLAKPMFTVFLDKSTSLIQGGGLLTYGGLDTNNCGPVRGWAPLTNETCYHFELQGISYGTKYKSSKKQQAVIDIGSIFIYGDRKIVQNMAKYMGAKYYPDFDNYYIDCDAEVEPITLTINGKHYTLPKESFIVNDPFVPKPMCLLAIFPHQYQLPGINWIFGDNFIRQFCTIHDIGNKRIGFAPSIQKK